MFKHFVPGSLWAAESVPCGSPAVRPAVTPVLATYVSRPLQQRGVRAGLSEAGTWAQPGAAPAAS